MPFGTRRQKARQENRIEQGLCFADLLQLSNTVWVCVVRDKASDVVVDTRRFPTRAEAVEAAKEILTQLSRADVD